MMLQPDKSLERAGAGGITRKKLSGIILAFVILLLIAIAIPNYLAERFDWVAAPLDIHVSVVDSVQGTPIEGAKVQVPGAFGDAVTDARGECESIAHFRATGTMGHSGVMHIYGEMRVEAPGYPAWERSFASLVGPRYDYFRKGTSFTYKVTLAK